MRNYLSMKGLDGGPIITRGGVDHTVGRIVGLESSGEILGANQGKDIMGRKQFRWMEVILPQPVSTWRKGTFDSLESLDHRC